MEGDGGGIVGEGVEGRKWVADGEGEVLFQANQTHKRPKHNNNINRNAICSLSIDHNKIKWTRVILQCHNPVKVS